MYAKCCNIKCTINILIQWNRAWAFQFWNYRLCFVGFNSKVKHRCHCRKLCNIISKRLFVRQSHTQRWRPLFQSATGKGILENGAHGFRGAAPRRAMKDASTFDGSFLRETVARNVFIKQLKFYERFRGYRWYYASVCIVERVAYRFYSVSIK